MKLAYDLFLFDLDDTLLDFKASERQSFSLALMALGISVADIPGIFEKYHVINHALWKAFEAGVISKEHLKIERFRQLFTNNKIDIDPSLASHTFLELLPETVVLVDHAVELCQELCHAGAEIGVITNGIESVQARRVQNSALAPFIRWVSVSDSCGFAKPDVRFFEYSVKMASKFSKASSLVVGDRLETDILGAHNFGVDACWYNPARAASGSTLPKFEIHHLSELRPKIFKI